MQVAVHGLVHLLQRLHRPGVEQAPVDIGRVRVSAAGGLDGMEAAIGPAQAEHVVDVEEQNRRVGAALLSLGERAAQGLGRGELSQVYIEGDAGTVFLISADDEAVLVAVQRLYLPPDLDPPTGVMRLPAFL